MSRICAGLDEAVGAFRTRRLDHDQFPYVYLDATYLHVRTAVGMVVSKAVVIATGISEHGRREVLGVDVGDSEDEVFWRAFMTSLKKRGLSGVRLVISDQHAGLVAAITRSFQDAAHQRGRVHFVRNVLAHVPKGQTQMVAAIFRTIFAQPDHDGVHRQWDKASARAIHALTDGCSAGVTTVGAGRGISGVCPSVGHETPTTRRTTMTRPALRITAVAFGLLAPLLTISPAHAGGAPDLGTVTVDRQAVIDRYGALELSGSYACTAVGTARIRADVYGWRAAEPATSIELTEVICDGATHRWTAKAPEGRYRLAGQALVWGSLEVCDPAGTSCPSNLFDQTIVVRAGR